MALIYITGHRNPDMDSICAAYSYAYLKNRVDRENTYKAVCLGPLNKACKTLFEEMKLQPPQFLPDVRTRVSSVKRSPSLILSSDCPVYDLVSMYNLANPSVVPILDNGEFKGLLSVDDINRYFLRENTDNRPEYDFRIDNIPRVLHGVFLKRGEKNVFRAPLMVGAMRFEVFKKRLAQCTVKPVLVVGTRKDHIDEAIKSGIPGIILTGVEEDSLEGIDFSSYKGMVYISSEDTAETIRLMRLSIPVADILSPDAGARVLSDMLFDEAKDALTSSGRRGLSVFDSDSGLWCGFITRRCFLDRPRQGLIMVDHNEAEQSVVGIEDADILEIVDHHRLDAPKTRNPINIITETVGSTCTIIYEQFGRWKEEIPPHIARILLSGLVSDTVMLKSPTTTSFDRTVAKELCAAASIDDFDAFCAHLFASGSSLKGQPPQKVVEADFKCYEESKVHFGIGQVEVMNLSEIDEVKDAYIEALEEECRSMHLVWAMLLVTNVISGNSILFSSKYPKSYRFMYEKTGEGVYNLPGVLSRKKQLLPEVIRVLES